MNYCKLLIIVTVFIPKTFDLYGLPLKKNQSVESADVAFGKGKSRYKELII